MGRCLRNPLLNIASSHYLGGKLRGPLAGPPEKKADTWVGQPSQPRWKNLGDL